MIQKILEIVNDRLNPFVQIHSESEICTRPPGMLIIGDVSEIVSEIREEHNSYEDPEGVKVPVVYVKIPEKTKTDHIVDLALENYRDTTYPPNYSVSTPLSQKLRIFQYYLKTCETRLIIFEKLENILSFNKNKRAEALNLIKIMFKSNCIPAILISAKKEITDIIPKDMPVNWVFKMDI
ncbi:MAG: TniB family NTP-binding protein [Candidatus Aenigmatarchaeota archaeon]